MPSRGRRRNWVAPTTDEVLVTLNARVDLVQSLSVARSFRDPVFTKILLLMSHTPNAAKSVWLFRKWKNELIHQIDIDKMREKADEDSFLQENFCRELERLKFDNPGPANLDFQLRMKGNASKDNKGSPVRRRRNQNRAARPTHPANAYYDDQGRMIVNGEDLCDCLSLKCPGCYYPCPKCSSTRCGIECRVRRRWTVDTIRINDTNVETLSPFLELIRLPLAKQQEWRNSKMNNMKKPTS